MITIHVIFYNRKKDVTNLECMALTVTHLALQTVRTARVTYRMERVMHVNLDGLELHVIQVRLILLKVFTLLDYYLFPNFMFHKLTYDFWQK